MKKIHLPISENINPVKLYYDELDKIIELVSEVSTDIEIKTDNYLLDNIKEIDKLSSTSIHNLHITIQKPYFSLCMDKDNIFLYASKNDFESRGLFGKVSDILYKRKNPLRLIMNFYVSGALAGAGLPISFFGVSEVIKKGDIQLAILYSILGVLLISIGIYGRFLAVNRYTTIFPNYKKEKPGFFKRNADILIVGIISVIVGGVISYFLNNLLQ